MHSIICDEILQRWKWRPTKSFLKIWLLSVNFEKFTSIHLWSNQSQLGVWRACDWLLHSFIEVNFSKLTDNNQIFRDDFAAFIITSKKIKFKLISANFFLPMISCNELSITLSTLCLRSPPKLIHLTHDYQFAPWIYNLIFANLFSDQDTGITKYDD